MDDRKRLCSRTFDERGRLNKRSCSCAGGYSYDHGLGAPGHPRTDLLSGADTAIEVIACAAVGWLSYVVRSLRAVKAEDTHMLSTIYVSSECW